MEHIISWTIIGSDKFTVVKVFEKRTQDLINLTEENHPCFVGFLSFTRTFNSTTDKSHRRIFSVFPLNGSFGPFSSWTLKAQVYLFQVIYGEVFVHL